MPILSRDFETQSAANLKKVGARRYAADPTTRVLCICYAIDDGAIESFIPESGKPVPDAFIEAANNPDWRVCAHNDAFESAIEEHVLGPRHSWPLVPVERHICTIAMARYYGLPGELGKIAALLNLPIQKDRAGARLMLELCRPRKPRPGEDPAQIYWPEITPEKLERLIAYCKNDVAVEREIYRRLPRLSDEEHRLWCLDRKINMAGFRVDLDLARAARKLVTVEKARINTEIATLTDGAVTGLTKLNDMREFINARGHRMTKLNERAVSAVLAHGPDDTVRKVLELRQASSNSAVMKYNAVLASAFPDQRVYGLLHYYGAHTGRWTSAGFNAHNLPREDADDALAAIAAIRSSDLEAVRSFGPPLEVIAGVARGLVVAPPGMLLLAGDFTSIEPRTAAWFAGEGWKLDNFRKFDATNDPMYDDYRILGARMRGRPVDPNDAEARQYGKTVTMAFNYGASVRVWRDYVRDDPRGDEEIKAQEVMKFRRLHPAQTQFMYDLDKQAMRCVRLGAPVVRKRHSFEMDGDTLILRLPSGRPLFYPKARIKLGKFGKDVIAYHASSKNCEVEMWYGAWLANLVSATARDLLVNALFKLDAAGFNIILHVHDEIVAEIDPENIERDRERFKACMLAAPSWAEGLPFAAKVRLGERYIKAEAPIEIKAEPIEVPDEPVIVASIPFMITRTMKEQLYSRGFSEQGVIEMTPQRAHELLTPEPADNSISAAPIEETSPPPSPDPYARPRESEPEQQTNEPISSTNDGGNGRTTWADEDYGAGEQSIGTPTATYIYRTETGAPFMRVKRTADKKFPTDHWENGRWVKGWPPRPFLPYRLPQLIAALPNVPVFAPEGEKDCERLAALGLIATCNSGGASASKVPKKSKWWPELNQHFAGKQLVYVLEDNDEPGRLLGEAKINALTPIVSEVVRVYFPELREGGDVSDWLDQLNPHTAHASLLARCEQARKHSTTSNYVLVRASDIVPRAMDWLWCGHILRGSQELLTGVPGGGKSQIHCALVAAVTTGGMWPDGSNGIPPGNVIMLTAEDCLDQTIVPRLIAAGANRDRVFILKKIRKDNKERMFLLNEDLEQLELMITKVGNVWLITIDPITAYMGSKIDSHRATDVRGQLGPLADLSERTNVALSAITHPPKHSTQRAIDHFIGSQAFIAAARIGHMAIEEVEEDEHGHRHPTSRSLFTNPKNNVSRKMPTLAYRIAEKQLDGEIKAAYVIWEDIVDITADQAIAATAPAKKNKSENVVEFLFDILAKKPAPFDVIEQRAAVHGFSKNQLDYAKRKMGIVAFKEKTFQGRWFWAQPQHAPPVGEDGVEL